MNLVDTHAHLDAPQFEIDRDAVVARARELGVEILCVSTDLASSEATLRLSERYNLFCAIGIHPHEAGSYVDGNGQIGAIRERPLQERLTMLAKNPRVVAIGEIGLDYFKNYAPRSAQQNVFRVQLELAHELDLPVIIHMRDSAEGILGELVQFEGLKGVVHSFTGDRELADRVVELGFHLGFNGIITFNKVGAQHAVPLLFEAVQAVPLERLLVETDAPFLAPVPQRGKRNEPVFVCHVAEFIADLRGLSLEEFARATTENARRLFQTNGQIR